MSRTHAAIVGTIVVVIFLALTVPRLESQGPYYDELHQAPAAFHYLGKYPIQFTWRFHGIPVFNMPYSGAIKSTVYGLYLRYINPHFTVFSWRLLGIVFVAAGLLMFYLFVGNRLSVATGVLFGLLVLSDSSIILTTRHDWGPTALAFGLRFVFLAVWLSIELGFPSTIKYGIAGFIVGIAVFEKLSSIALIPVLFILLISSLKGGRKSWLAGICGLIAGVVPLILANLSTYRGAGMLISLSGVSAGSGPYRLSGTYEYAFQFLALAQGVIARTQILGEPTDPVFAGLEAGVMLFLLLIVSAAAWRFRREHRLLKLAGTMAASYAVVSLALFLLPRATYVHHWVVGTPFQYCAIALALPALAQQISSRQVRFYRVALQLALLFLVAGRLVNLVAIESSLLSGKASTAFAPSFKRLLDIASTKTTDAILVSSDWGSGTQTYCGGNGEDDFVYEPFWDTNPSEKMLRIASETRKRTLYVLTTKLAPEFNEASSSILRAMDSAPGWHEVPIDTEFTGIDPISARKFVRSADQ